MDVALPADGALAWRQAEDADRAAIAALAHQSPGRGLGLLEAMALAEAHQLPLRALRWGLACDPSGQPLAVATSQHWVELVAHPALGPDALWPWVALHVPNAQRLQGPPDWLAQWDEALLALMPEAPVALTLQAFEGEAEALSAGSGAVALTWASEAEVPQAVRLDRWHHEALLGADRRSTEACVRQLLWLVAQRRLVVAKQGDEVLFQAYFSPATDDAAEVHGLCTHPQARGQGLARRALPELARMAAERGWASLRTSVPAGDAGLVAMHLAAGYRLAEGLGQRHWC